MSLRTAFIWYVLIAAVLATTACMIIVKCLDEPRIALYFKYQEQAQLIPVPEGGNFQNYVSTDGDEVYVIFDSGRRGGHARGHPLRARATSR